VFVVVIVVAVALIAGGGCIVEAALLTGMRYRKSDKINNNSDAPRNAILSAALCVGLRNGELLGGNITSSDKMV
jgi:hypothetical protein